MLLTLSRFFLITIDGKPKNQKLTPKIREDITLSCTKKSTHETQSKNMCNVRTFSVDESVHGDTRSFNTVINPFYASGLLNNEQHLHAAEKGDRHASPQKALLIHFPPEQPDNNDRNGYEVHIQRSPSIDIGNTPTGEYIVWINTKIL